ncbi:MAG: VCBS repeat-containing protein [Polyangiaceae bacterium]
MPYLTPTRSTKAFFTTTLLVGHAACVQGPSAPQPSRRDADTTRGDAALDEGSSLANADSAADAGRTDARVRDGALVDAGKNPGCEAASALLFWDDPAKRSTMLIDLTGDMVPDSVAIVKVGQSEHRLDVGAPAVASITGIDGPSWWLAVGTIDVNGDGQMDLGVGVPWDNRVHVFYGPLVGDHSWQSADLVISGPPNAGLAPLMGISFASTDVNGDGYRDLVVTSPGEGEEGCLGFQPGRIYYGPFASKETRDEQNVSARLARHPNSAKGCIGEKTECSVNGLKVASTIDAVCYPLPLTGQAPMACP